MLKKIFVTIISIILLMYFCLLAALYLFQENLIFPGEKLPNDFEFSYDLPYKEITLPVNGAQLHGLHFTQENPRGLFFFLHGNAGNVHTWTDDVEYFQAVNYDLFIFDYRGYGKSTGKISSQQELYDDVRVAWDYIISEYKDKPVVIYGRSLGSALATQLAKDVNPNLLVLVSPFTSMTAMAKQEHPIAPSWLLRYPFPTDEMIKEVNAKVVLIHGDADAFISLDHSKSLQKLTQQKSELMVIKDGDHSDIHDLPDYKAALSRALDSIDEKP